MMIIKKKEYILCVWDFRAKKCRMQVPVVVAPAKQSSHGLLGVGDRRRVGSGTLNEPGVACLS